MTNRHRQKYILNLLLGLALVSGGVMSLLYMTRLNDIQEEWYIWAITSLVLINTGLFLLGTAFVHKVKSDLIRKQKIKEQHKKYEFE